LIDAKSLQSATAADRESHGMKRHTTLIALAVLLMLPVTIHAQTPETASPAVGTTGGGTIVGKAVIVDGDTIEIGGRQIDLFGIDAPENDQLCEAAGRKWSCGQNATFGLTAIVERQWVHCRTMKTYAAGRIAAICRLAGTDGPDVNAAMVRQGWAVADKAAPAPYLAEENASRAAKAGIWVGQQPDR
jgi:endonuclease YncB( thermonuclease family)